MGTDQQDMVQCVCPSTHWLPPLNKYTRHLCSLWLRGEGRVIRTKIPYPRLMETFKVHLNHHLLDTGAFSGPQSKSRTLLDQLGASASFKDTELLRADFLFDSNPGPSVQHG